MSSGQEGQAFEQLIGVTEAARLLAVKPSWIYANASQLPAFHVGKYVRFRASELLVWLEQRRANGNGAR